MTDFAFEIVDWLAAPEGDADGATLASLKIVAGAERALLTEVEDTIARTVRGHINVSALALARWLLANWWRLRWEPHPKNPADSWAQSHCMAAIGGGFAWPAVEFSSDGDFIQVCLEAEASADVAAVRYLQNVVVDVPTTQFEKAVDRFADEVEARILACTPHERSFSELKAELQEERATPELARACAFQALAGLHPGEAPPEWLAAAKDVVDKAGPQGGEEVLATVPQLEGGLDSARRALEAMRESTTRVQLNWVSTTVPASASNEVPWQRGVRLARALRKELSIPSGPITTALEHLLDVRLPLESLPKTTERVLRGGYRNGSAQGRTPIVLASRRPESQRFELARLIGCAMVSVPGQHVLPVSDAATALQKFERSFAQEFLCPWEELDDFTDENGTDQDAIADAAAHFQVSEWLILSTLVNRRKVPRYRLPS